MSVGLLIIVAYKQNLSDETAAFYILQSIHAMAIALHVNSCSSPPFD